MRFVSNPYIVGQVTLLLGAMSLGLAVLPAAVMAESPDELSVVDELEGEVDGRVKPFRVASMAVAILGLAIGPIGWLREKPPLLPISGMCLCGVALLWYWIVLGVMIAVLILALAALAGALTG